MWEVQAIYFAFQCKGKRAVGKVWHGYFYSFMTIAKHSFVDTTGWKHPPPTMYLLWNQGNSRRHQGCCYQVSWEHQQFSCPLSSQAILELQHSIKTLLLSWYNTAYMGLRRLELTVRHCLRTQRCIDFSILLLFAISLLNPTQQFQWNPIGHWWAASRSSCFLPLQTVTNGAAKTGLSSEKMPEKSRGLCGCINGHIDMHDWIVLLGG